MTNGFDLDIREFEQYKLLFYWLKTNDILVKMFCTKHPSLYETKKDHDPNVKIKCKADKLKYWITNNILFN